MSAKFVKFSAKFGSLNVQIRNNLKNIIFIAFLWCKVCKYYVNSMVSSCSACQKEEIECMWVKYLIYAVLSQSQFRRNLRIFPPNLYFQSFRVHKKNGFFQVWVEVQPQFLFYKNPAHGRQSNSRPMRIVAPIPKKSC